MSIAGEGVRKQENNRTWLVKSGDRILGPYTGEEIEQRLRSKEFVAIDEVVSPQGRWRYVRDEPVFMTVVEEIRRGMMSLREDTEVQGATSTSTQTATETSTQTSTDTTPIYLDDQTPIPTPISSSSAQAKQMRMATEGTTVRDAEFVEAPVVPPARPTSAEKPSRSVRQYGMSGEGSVRQIRDRVSRFMIFLWIVTAGVVGYATYFVMKERGTTPQVVPADHSAEFRAAQLKGNQAWEMGELATALKAYREANQFSPGRTEIAVREAILMMKIEGQTVAAKRQLESILNRVADPAIEQEAKIGLGLADLIGEDFAEAERRFLAASMRGPNAMVAQFNAGAAAYMAHDFPEAVRLFTDAGDEPAATLMMARSALALTGSERQQVRETAAERLDNLIKSQADFRQEAQVVASYLSLESGNKKKAQALAKGAFESDPLLTSEHYHSPLLYLEPLEWRSLVPLCRELADKLKSSVTRALLAICMEKSGQREEALKMIADGLASMPNDSAFHSANAYVLMVSGRDVDARASLRLATKEEASPLAQILSGRVCARLHETDCAEAEWTQLSQNLPAGLAALLGLAEIRIAQNEKAQAEEMIRLALSMSPRYLPAVRMRISGGR